MRLSSRWFVLSDISTPLKGSNYLIAGRRFLIPEDIRVGSMKWRPFHKKSSIKPHSKPKYARDLSGTYGPTYIITYPVNTQLIDRLGMETKSLFRCLYTYHFLLFNYICVLSLNHFCKSAVCSIFAGLIFALLSRNFRRSFCIYLCMVLIFLFQAFLSTNCCCSPRAILDVTRGNSAGLKLRQTWLTLFIDALGGVQIWRRLSDLLSRFLDDVFKSHFLARHPSVPLEILFLVLSDI